MAAKQGRDALDGLSKDELVSRAEALGIDGARKFTKVELVDEITRASGSTDRGLLGRARDLLRGVVEKGLARSSPPPKLNGDHTAERVESGSSGSSVEAGRPSTTPEPPVPTVTLAEIYVGQGHVARAKAIAREVLRNDEGDAAARALLEKLESEADTATRARPAMKLEKGVLPDDPYARVGIEAEAFVEPSAVPHRVVPSMLDDAPFPARYDVDECVAMAADPTTVYVYWESRPTTVERARRVLARANEASSKSILRVLVVEPLERGPRVSTRDFDIIDVELGEWFVRDLPAGAIVRAAIGLKSGERFLPVAHTGDVEAPVNKPSEAVAHELVVWTEGETRARTTRRSSLPPIARDAGTLGLPALPEPPEDEITAGRGLSSAELARRARIVRARREGRPEGPAHEGPGLGASDLLAKPGSASWLVR